jgi:SAM-dependent methyltransferase
MPYFDHFAAGRSTALGDWLTRRTVSEEFRFLRRHFAFTALTRILEIGPGFGELAELFLANGCRNYDIVEPNTAMRHRLRTRGVREAKEYAIPQLQEKDSSYDLIILSNVFEHLGGSAEAQTFIAEAARVLSDGGMLFLLSPDYRDWGNDFFNCDFSHTNPTTVRRVTQMLQNAGIEMVDYAYRYACFGGLPGWILSRAIKLTTSWTSGEDTVSKAYKFRLTFLRRFMILGRNRRGDSAHSPRE